MSKKLCLFFALAWFFFFPTLAHGKTYSTSSLNLTQISAISWRFLHLTSPNDFQIQLQKSNSDALIPFTDFTCQTQTDELVCSFDLASFPSAQNLIFHFNYPDNATFYLNVKRQAATTNDFASTPDFSRQNLFYGPLKILTTDLEPQSLSWSETNYALLNQASDSAQTMPDYHLLVQYRPTFNDGSSSAWLGNYHRQTALPDQTFSSTTSALLLPELSGQAEQFLSFSLLASNAPSLQLSYQQDSQTVTQSLPLLPSLSPTKPIATGNLETDAFANTTFYLDNLNGLSLGETLVIRETVAGQTYQLAGDIIDLKPSTGLVTVNSWSGAIPPQNSQLCQNQNFCFSTQAQVSKIQDVFLAVPADISQLTLSSSQNFSLEISNFYLGTLTSPSCLQQTADYCTLYSLTFDFPQPPTLLQYRLINFYPDFIDLDSIYLHQKSLSSSTPAASTSAATFNRLRHGKTLDSTGLSRAYYW